MNQINNMNTFKNAQEAFEYYYDNISDTGIDFDGTKALFNVGFTIENPLDNNITTNYRKFNLNYANNEWLWYLSGDQSVNKLGEINGLIPRIWTMICDEDGNVNSNYGWQWKRNNQLDKVIKMIKDNKNTRRAAISIYDGKEIDKYSKDTCCTYAVQFTVVNDKLNMSVYMRSNDLWFGFCNDQFCFSKLQELVSKEVGIEVGTYYHHAHNLHIYNNFLNRK